MKYLVSWSQTLKYSGEIEADNPEEAKKKMKAEIFSAAPDDMFDVLPYLDEIEDSNPEASEV